MAKNGKLTAKRDLKPGDKPNPADRLPGPGPGRPPGKRNKATEIAQSLLDGEAGTITRKCIELALTGDGKVQGIALKLCIERIIPPRKILEIEGEALKSLSDDQLKLRIVELLGSLSLAGIDGNSK